ncbi:MAG: hypothetical protein WA814_13925 [Candidatus Baltobacteraceae bacterium]
MRASLERLIGRGGEALAVAGAAAFAAFVAANGVPTLRHDWSWPIGRDAIASFVNESLGGWVSVGFGVPNPHPTTYLIALPIASLMWLFGPYLALVLTAFAIGYLCMRAAALLSSAWGYDAVAAFGIGLFALFNPWVYNEVVAGHLVMVLAFGGSIGLLAEMMRGANASPVRLALWLALVASQLQFFILAMLALAVFAAFTKRWLPVVAGLCFALPTAIGLVAERSTLLATPYNVTWQANQSVAPLPLLALGGYFPGYADRLGVAAQLAVWAMLGLAALGALVAVRRRRAVWAIVALVALYVAVLGTNGPFAAQYEWVVRHVPESGVFRELYDIAGLLAALIVLLAFAATSAVRPLAYAGLCAGAVLLVTWIARPPSDLWIAAGSYPRPAVSAPAFARVALLPAFQPLGLRVGGGDGADPDVYVYPAHVAALNAYLPTYPVDVALARFERTGDEETLRALGVVQIVSRPWLMSRSNGRIGLAARSLAAAPARAGAVPQTSSLGGATPLVSACETPRIVALALRLGACNLFFGDVPGYEPVRAELAQSDSIDPQTAWIDARLAFAAVPALAQGIGGTLTQSRVPYRVEPGSALLAYVRGRLNAADGRRLAGGGGGFTWFQIPPDVSSVVCDGLCELVAQTRTSPRLPPDLPPARSWALRFRRPAPWLYVVDPGPRPAPLLRLNERYDPGWAAISGWRVLPHLRIDVSTNGWAMPAASTGEVILVQVTALLQLIAQLFGFLALLWLLKALVRAPTKRAGEP